MEVAGGVYATFSQDEGILFVITKGALSLEESLESRDSLGNGRFPPSFSALGLSRISRIFEQSPFPKDLLKTFSDPDFAKVSQ